MDYKMTNSDLIERLEASTGEDARILSHVIANDSGCWDWALRKGPRGRGRVFRAGKIMLHHRAVWEILIGPIKHGAFLCHTCDNPSCCNPSHLYEGTAQSNVDDMMNRGRHWTHSNPEKAMAMGKSLGSSNDWSKGESNCKAKLSIGNVKEIYLSDKATKILSDKFCVCYTTIQRIRNGSLWSHVTSSLKAMEN